MYGAETEMPQTRGMRADLEKLRALQAQTLGVVREIVGAPPQAPGLDQPKEKAESAIGECRVMVRTLLEQAALLHDQLTRLVGEL